MSSPNVVCQIYFLDNEQALAKNPLREEKYGAKRRFYSCKNSKYNYVDYVQDGSKNRSITWTIRVIPKKARECLMLTDYLRKNSGKA